MLCVHPSLEGIPPLQHANTFQKMSAVRYSAGLEEYIARCVCVRASTPVNTRRLTPLPHAPLLVDVGVAGSWPWAGSGQRSEGGGMHACISR